MTCCRDLREHVQAMAASVAKYKSMANKSYTLLGDTRAAYKSVRTAAKQAAADLQALQKEHADTKAQLQELREQYSALQALVAQDSYAMIVPGQAQADHGQAIGNTNLTEQDRELIMLAGKVCGRDE
jgi:chromosome segregation ATPase